MSTALSEPKISVQAVFCLYRLRKSSPADASKYLITLSDSRSSGSHTLPGHSSARSQQPPLEPRQARNEEDLNWEVADHHGTLSVCALRRFSEGFKPGGPFD